MAATVIPFPKPFQHDHAVYIEPYEAEYLALVATDSPVPLGRSTGQVVDIRTRSVLEDSAPSASKWLTAVGLSKSA